MKPNHPPHSCNCGCCAAAHSHAPGAALNRRDFLFRVGAATATGLAFSAPWMASPPVTRLALPVRGPLPKRALKVQPVLTYALPHRREGTSWRPWGGLQTEQDVAAEKGRINAELAKIKAKADFALEVLPLAAAANAKEADTIAQGDYDTMLVYAAGGGGDILQKLILPGKFNLMFLRHEPGPVYLWYEIAHPHFLRKAVDEFDVCGLDVSDVVVDNPDELLWRFRALHGLRNTLGKRIVAIGGPGGWGAGGRNAPETARNLWKLDIVDYSYKDLGPRLKAARQNADLVKRCEAAAGHYLRQSRVSLHTDRSFVNKAVVLNEVMKDILDEAHTDAITVNACMGTIMTVSETTACMPLSWLNDDGYLAFCESDFVVIPSGILLHYISGKPVFLNDPTFPHDNVVTMAHCTAPRKMDGRRAERVKVLTHFESDYGAAPKVEMKLGQVCTTLVPDFACKKWVGFEGKIVGNPFLDICRSQIDVKVLGDGQALLREMKGFHWMMCYDNYLRETGYALKKLNVDLHNVSRSVS